MLRVIFSFLFFTSLLSHSSEYLEKALSAYQKKDIETAYIHLKNALQENEDNLPARVLMGRVLLEKGLFYDAIQEFDDALALGADPNQFIFEQVRAMLLIGRNQELIDLLAKLKLNTDVKVKTLLITSNAYIAMEKEDLALEPLLTAKDIAPNDVSVISSLTNYYINQRNFVLAEKGLNEALALAADNSKIWHLHASFNSAQGYHLKALNSLEKAYALDPEDPVIMRALAHKYTDLRQHENALNLVNDIIEKTPNDPYARLLKSQLLTQSNQLEEAQQILQDISSKLSLLTDAQKNSNSSLAYVSGAAAFMQGNLELAQKELLFYVKENPNDLTGLNMLSAIYSQQGQTDKIQSLLEKNEKIVLRDLNLSLKLFNVYLQGNKIYKAKNILEDLAKTYPDNIQVIIAKSNYLAQNKRFQDAITLLNEYKPEEVRASYILNKGLIYMQMGNFEQATIIADQLLAIAPKNNSFKNFKGVILLKSGQLPEAAAIFEQILADNADNYSTVFNLANTYAQQKKQKEALTLILTLTDKGYEQVELLLLKAKLERDVNQPNQAIDTVQFILERDGFNTNALDLLMTLYYQQGKLSEALEVVNKLSNILFLEPKHLIYKANILIKQEEYEAASKPLGVLLGLAKQADDFYQLSLLYAKAMDNQNAYSTIEQALALSPARLIYLLTQARLAIEIKSTDYAQQLITTLRKKHPNNPNVELLQGDLWFKQSNFVKAQLTYQKALSLDSRFDQAIAKLYLLANNGVGEKTFVSKLESLLANKQSTPLARNLLADYYLNTGQYQQAKVHYELLVDKPVANKANILNNLANIYIDIDLNKAKSLIDRAIALVPNSSAFIDTLGWILIQQGDYKAALTELRNAYVLNSNNPAISYHLGYALNKLGRIDEAKIELKKAVDSSVKFSDKNAAIALLASLTES